MKIRTLLLRWSRHRCRLLPATTPVQFDLPCPRCGWHVTGAFRANTENEMLVRVGAPVETHKLDGPLSMFLNHYDLCLGRGAKQ